MDLETFIDINSSNVYFKLKSRYNLSLLTISDVYVCKNMEHASSNLIETSIHLKPVDCCFDSY